MYWANGTGQLTNKQMQRIFAHSPSINSHSKVHLHQPTKQLSSQFIPVTFYDHYFGVFTPSYDGMNGLLTAAICDSMAVDAIWHLSPLTYCTYEHKLVSFTLIIIGSHLTGMVCLRVMQQQSRALHSWDCYCNIRVCTIWNTLPGKCVINVLFLVTDFQRNKCIETHIRFFLYYTTSLWRWWKTSLSKFSM